MGAVDTVEAEVRERVRRGLDPVVDRLVMRMLIDEVVSEKDACSLASSLPPLADSRLAAKSVYDAVAGYGPLQRHFNDFSGESVDPNKRLTAGETRRNAADSVSATSGASPVAHPAGTRAGGQQCCRRPGRGWPRSNWPPGRSCEPASSWSEAVSGRYVQDEAEDFADLGERCLADVAERLSKACRRYGPDVLTLR